MPGTSSTRSTRFAREPNSPTHLAAVFSPTPGMLGRLSEGSPRSAAKSGYWAGVSAYLACTDSGVNRVMSETPLTGYSTVTSGVTSWIASRSPVQMRTVMPCAVARVVRVAMTSSASKFTAVSDGIRSAPSTSRTSSTWPLNSSGALDRLAL